MKANLYNKPWAYERHVLNVAKNIPYHIILLLKAMRMVDIAGVVTVIGSGPKSTEKNEVKGQ